MRLVLGSNQYFLEGWQRHEMELDMGMDMEDIDADRNEMSLSSEAMTKRVMDIFMAT